MGACTIGNRERSFSAVVDIRASCHAPGAPPEKGDAPAGAARPHGRGRHNGAPDGTDGSAHGDAPDRTEKGRRRAPPLRPVRVSAR
ncbi:hypothetical protein GCM10022244_33250 [Streptomyces gulbargensis]|uniref:Uncharacterized protein n=1 Tax=Streptomyces gulbargensis TaxID=364901 RepID=A0ABP7MFU2_9ACTN